MLKLLIVLAFVTALAAAASAAPEPTTQPAEPHAQIAALAKDPANKLKAFTPKVTFRTGRGNRHVPMVYGSSPWGAKSSFPVEVPECIHGRHDGDRRKGFLFWGRPLNVLKDRGVRYPSLEKPQWKRITGGLSLDNPLADGLTVHFRVIGHDRMMEIRFGITNNSDKTIRNSWAQICAKSDLEPVLAEKHPTSSHMLSGGELISWDSAGQDLAWLDDELTADGKGYKRSCFFIAQVGTGKIQGRRTQQPLLTLGRKVDVPAIAKADKAKRRAVIVYSPSATRAFYNVLQPCFHADPYLADIKPGTTEWARTYLIYFEGDLAAYMKKLSAVHKKIVAAKKSPAKGKASPPAKADKAKKG